MFVDKIFTFIEKYGLITHFDVHKLPLHILFLLNNWILFASEN